MKKRILIAFLCLIIFGTTFGLPQPSCADETTGGILLTCPSAILMEASTKSVIYEKAPDERRSPASITKIMTAILIFDAIEAGKISQERYERYCKIYEELKEKEKRERFPLRMRL